MIPPENKTKIICTIGPASQDQAMIEKLLLAGMNIARLNFSHGDFTGHQNVIKNIRAASKKTGRRIAIMADLPGPKMRIGKLKKEPIHLNENDVFTLTTEETIGDQTRVSVSFKTLHSVVKPGDNLFLNDGLIKLVVISINGNDVVCDVHAGGELRSRKGLNLPGIDLGMSAFTPHDYNCLKFALENGVDAISQSFVCGPEDVQAVRNAATDLGYSPFIIAKIERSDALNNIDAIIAETDGIMVARGDLGVEIAIERMAVVQKFLMDKANRAGKPVITATHMLESMVEHRRPTRAEATDVANAILDGTDCVMLSGESAMGRYPVESTKMLAQIAIATEPHRTNLKIKEALKSLGQNNHLSNPDLISLSIYNTIERGNPVAVLVPTCSGATARNITRFRLSVWITAFSSMESTCQALQFSYGVYPKYIAEEYHDWSQFARDWLNSCNIKSGIAILTQGPSEQNPKNNHSMEIISLDDA